MNKTISINLGGRNFFIEEDAYKKLDAYLSAIRQHFSSYHGSEEIVADMESRIAEKFLEKYESNAQAVITNSDVDALIAELGTVEDITGEDTGSKSGHSSGSKQSFAKKRLMRNGDDKIIAGVASGMAAYFGIDPIIIRLIFGLLLFAGGSIIPIYILLWIIMPEAKSPTEKMEMRGEPFNLDSINETIKERAEEFKSHVKNVSEKEEWKKWKDGAKTQAKNMADEAAHAGKRGGETFKNFLGEIVRGLGRAISLIVRFILGVVGFFIIIGMSVAMAAITFALVAVIFNIHSPYLGLPVAAIAKGPEFYVLLFVAYLIALIPLQFILMLGSSLMSKRNVFKPAAGFGLLGVWLAALIVGGAMGARYIPEYVDQVKNSPEFQTVNKSFDVANFNKVSLYSSMNYKLIEGAEFKVEAKGWTSDLERINVSVDGDTLNINSDGPRFCFFCFSRSPYVEITAPSFNSITAGNSSNIEAPSINASSTTLFLENSADATINYNVENLSVMLSNSSDARLSGQAVVLKADLMNSSDLRAEKLQVTNAEITSVNSSDAWVNVSETLKYEMRNSSDIYYFGFPKITGNKEDYEDGPMPLTAPNAPYFQD